jgi:hypothetical protein
VLPRCLPDITSEEYAPRAQDLTRPFFLDTLLEKDQSITKEARTREPEEELGDEDDEELDKYIMSEGEMQARYSEEELAEMADRKQRLAQGEKIYHEKPTDTRRSAREAARLARSDDADLDILAEGSVASAIDDALGEAIIDQELRDELGDFDEEVDESTPEAPAAPATQPGQTLSTLETEMGDEMEDEEFFDDEDVVIDDGEDEVFDDGEDEVFDDGEDDEEQEFYKSDKAIPLLDEDEDGSDSDEDGVAAYNKISNITNKKRKT